MQYTLRNIPRRLNEALRRTAKEQGKTLNEVAVMAMQRGIGLEGEAIRHRSLGDLAGTWVEDPEFDAAIADQDRIDPELWR